MRVRARVRVRVPLELTGRKAGAREQISTPGVEQPHQAGFRLAAAAQATRQLDLERADTRAVHPN